MTPPATTIDLLRHGECEGGHVYRGSLDVPLNDQGWLQLRQQTRQSPGWQQIVSSPLRRCADFAGELAQSHALPVEQMDAFREVHFGDWEGRAIADVWREQGNHVRRFFADPVNAAPPNGEAMADFEQRVLAGWHAMLSRYRGQHILLVAHGGTIRILLAAALAMPLHRIAGLEVPYACASRLRIYHGDPSHPAEPLPDFATLVFHNGTFV